MDISVVIMTKNSERRLKEVLASVKSFAQVVVYDTGSQDGTRAIAEQFRNVEWHEGPFIGFGPTRNRAAKKAKYPWIFALDSDEVVPEALVREIQALTLREERVYSVSRKNFFRGKWIRWCGWWPDRVVRIYNQTKTRFCDRQVHEAVEIQNLELYALHAPLYHYPYEKIGDFLAKMQSYTTLFAEENRGKKSSSPWKAIGHGFFAFFKSYILKKGFMGGFEGFFISVYNGHTAFYKYLKLYEIADRSS